MLVKTVLDREKIKHREGLWSSTSKVPSSLKVMINTATTPVDCLKEDTPRLLWEIPALEVAGFRHSVIPDDPVLLYHYFLNSVT